ncbi:unnamed protein product [Cyclocybe aegerita]|uniref:Uncharacterized protein n=1 Tax=Cyclocybe aegerita TaxID=1973307 RepID=A0A8S0X526_CYCAE|nr:unnamed protein product [Cyclocybe aegerita]
MVQRVTEVARRGGWTAKIIQGLHEDIGQSPYINTLVEWPTGSRMRRSEDRSQRGSRLILGGRLSLKKGGKREVVEVVQGANPAEIGDHDGVHEGCHLGHKGIAPIDGERIMVCSLQNPICGFCNGCGQHLKILGKRLLKRADPHTRSATLMTPAM